MIEVNDSQAPIYEASHGFDLRTVTVFAGTVLFSVLMLIPALDIPLAIRICGVALFGGGALLMAAGAVTRKTAFRVDETGILLGGPPIRYRAMTVHVPWQDITAVVLWRQQVLQATLPWVGVVRREGAPPLPGSEQGRVARAVTKVFLPVPAELILASRPVNGWRLDKERLATAVAYFAPGVAILDQNP